MLHRTLILLALLVTPIAGHAAGVVVAAEPRAAAALSSPSTTPPAIARDGSSGVLDTFQTRTSPVA